MERAADQAAFARDPLGTFVAGRSWAHFCVRAELFGVLFFGRPDGDDLAALVRSLRTELGERVAPHASVVDARRLEGVEPGAFDALHAYVREQHAALKARVTRLALLRPAGLEGAVVAGFFQTLEPPYPVALFDDVPPALAWLDVPAALAADVAAVATAVLGTDPLRGALRAWLDRHRDAPDIARAARTLGLSERTLQRRLREAGTTFQREVLGARLRAAERRMLESDAPLTTIALEAGFASLQNFSAVFRKATGVAPSAWRAARRRG